MSRAFGPVLLLLLAGGLAACDPAAGPEEVVRNAMEDARAGRLDAFLDRFEPRSRDALGAFWALSDRYGYLGPDALPHMADLTVVETEADRDVATVTVRDGDRVGRLRLVRIGGEWKLDLLSQ
jgi:hypothetical protein